MRHITALLLTLILVITLSVPALAADTFQYTHEDSGCRIPVPTVWKLEYEDDGVTFIPRGGGSVSMSYNCINLWDGLSSTEQKKSSRAEYNNEQIALADIADLLDVRSKDVKRINLAGTEYFQVTKTTTTGFFIFKTTTTEIYLIHVAKGWLHQFRFGGNDEHDLYLTFEDLVAGTVYDEPHRAQSSAEGTLSAATEEPKPAETVRSDANIYQEAIDAYEDGYYATAKKLFSSIEEYEDSEDYLRLIQIRSYGSNTGIGCVYNFNNALTDSQKQEIDKAAKRFYFADTAEVLLCNTDVACYYLFGNWITASNAPAYAYFKLHKDSVGGYYYTRSSNLSNAVSDCVSIIDGDVRISITSSNTLVFHIDLTAPDCMDIYSYETCRSFTLFRN